MRNPWTDISILIRDGITLEQSLQVVQQTAQGLAHIHQHQVYHQDIKPANLLLTTTGIVKIIDFNIAVTETNEAPASAATQRYLPPDYDKQKSPTS